MQNVLDRKKIKFPIFIFSSYGHFCYVITPIFDEFFTITRKIKSDNYFFIRFSALRIFHRNGIKTEMRGSAYP